MLKIYVFKYLKISTSLLFNAENLPSIMVDAHSGDKEWNYFTDTKDKEQKLP